MIGKKKFEINQERIEKAQLLMKRFKQMEAVGYGNSDEEDPSSYLKVRKT
jgi:hypothetical protein